MTSPEKTTKVYYYWLSIICDIIDYQLIILVKTRVGVREAENDQEKLRFYNGLL